MDKNQAIEIRQVGNGFVVAPTQLDNSISSLDAIHVFRSMKELKQFLTGHFDHRAVCIDADS